MEKIKTVVQACQALADLDVHPKNEYVPVGEAYGRVAAERVTAKLAVPSFPKSAYDGYALRREDIKDASLEHPVTLRVTETIPAGSVAKYPITAQTAARIMTGAMLPKGADVVIKHEDTRFSEKEVCFFQPATASNIVEVGEDVAEGECLIEPGKVLAGADMALLAGQGRKQVCVYQKPRIALLSTGSELLAQGQEMEAGKIYNTNPYLLKGYLEKYGMLPIDCGIAKDDPGRLAARICEALTQSDMVLTTGGVSAGDFDYVRQVMEHIGARVLFHRLPFKPGGAMLAAEKEGKVILGLSGNPGAAAVGMLRVGLPYMKKLCGRFKIEWDEAEAELTEAFPKSSKGTRLLRGQARIEAGRLLFDLTENQRNGAVMSMMDCNLLGEIPPGSGPLPAGAKIKVYFV